jgi:23S rRNA (uracil1939-C5)-methyltransferase
MQETFINIKSLDMDARGVGHLENEDGSPGKVIFVEGALPGERVSFETLRKKKNWESGRMLTLQKASSMRVEPKCPHFAQCGGCSMQHLEPSAQVAMKQRVLEDNLWHIGKTKADNIMRPMHGPTWDYRYRARLSVRWVAKKDTIMVGFHERHSSFVAHMTSCEIMPDHLSDMLVPLRALIRALSIYDQVPQIEVAVGEAATVLVLRIMAPLRKADEKLLKAFADQWDIQWWLQTKGPETAAPFYPLGKELYYTLPEFGIKMPFKPTDFTQVNYQINRLLVGKALRLLEVQKDDRVADLFCGLGNFTLPLATQAREVVGIEGSTALTTRALENARANGLDAKTSFSTRNLFEITRDDLVALGKFDRMLVDPPRDGAVALVQALAELRKTHPS